MKLVAILAAILALAAGHAMGACSKTRVDLRGDWGRARFTVEVADNRAEQELGLMNRQSLATSKGMLFVYGAPQRVVFWMKNTLIPLDMLFVGADGVVRKVHENAVPMDTSYIYGGDDIQFVLEINGGLAGGLGIGAGSQLRSPLVDQSLAAWTCDEP